MATAFIEKIEHSKVYRWGVVTCVIITLGSFVSGVCLWLLGYSVELHKVNSVTPLLYLFPGQKVRLDFDLHGHAERTDIKSTTHSKR